MSFAALTCATAQEQSGQSIVNSYLSERAYFEWHRTASPDEKRVPEIIRNRTQIGLKVGSLDLAALDLYPYIGWLQRKGIESRHRDSFMREMATWLSSDLPSERIVAKVMLLLEFPSLKDDLQGSPVSFEKHRAERIARKIYQMLDSRLQQEQEAAAIRKN